MMKSIRRLRSRKSKTVDSPPENGSSSGGDSSQLENMGALETPSRRQQQLQENDNTHDNSTPATDITHLVQSDDEDNEIYEDEDVSISSGERMVQKRQNFFKAEKPVFIQDELEALRTRQLAKNLRKELQAAEKNRTTSAPFATVDTESFFLKQNEQNKEWRKKQEDSRNYLNSYRGSGDNNAGKDDSTVNKNSKKYGRAVNASAATSEMDQFYSKQKAMKNEWKQKQRDANDLLHQYRGHADEKELQVKCAFEELVAWQMQAAGIPLPDSPLAPYAKFADDNSDASVAKVPLPCLGHPPTDLEPSSEPLIGKDTDSVVQKEGAQGGSTSTDPLNEMGGILDKMSELLVEMEVMSHVEVYGVQKETANGLQVEKEVCNQLGASLSITDAETQAMVVKVEPVTKEDGCAIEEAGEIEQHMIVDLDEPLITKNEDRNGNKAELEDPAVVDSNQPLTKEDDLPIEKAEEVESPIAVHSSHRFAKEEGYTIEEAEEIEQHMIVDLDEPLITKEEDRNGKEAELEDPAVVDSNEPLTEEEGYTVEEVKEVEARIAVDSSEPLIAKEGGDIIQEAEEIEKPVVADLDEPLITKEEDRNVDKAELEDPAIVDSNVPLAKEKEHTAEDLEAPIAVDSRGRFVKEKYQTLEETEEQMVAGLDDPLTTKEEDHNADEADEFDDPDIVDSNEPLTEEVDHTVEEAEEVEARIAVDSSKPPIAKEGADIVRGAEEIEHPFVVNSNEPLIKEGGEIIEEADKLKESIYVDLDEPLLKEEEHIVEEAGERGEPMVVDLDDELAEIDQAQAVEVDSFDDLLDDILDDGDFSADEPGAGAQMLGVSSVTGTAANYTPEDEPSAERVALETSAGNSPTGGSDIEQQLPGPPDVLELCHGTQPADEPAIEPQTLGASAEIRKVGNKAGKSRTERHSRIPTPTSQTNGISNVGTPRAVRRLNDDSTPRSTISPARRSRAAPRYGVNSPSRVTDSTTVSRNSQNTTPRASRGSDDDSTACSTASSSRRSRGTPRYGMNSPSHLANSTVTSRNARREKHYLVSHFNSYSPGKAGVHMYRCQSSKIPQACTSQLILELHDKHSGCERCLHFASPSARRKYDKEGHHYRINMVRGGCCRKCKLFPREENEPAVRLCRQCFYDTHRHGKI